FLHFRENDDRGIYYATYTAFDGKSIHTMLLETADFMHFRIKKLNGLEIKNKNLSLFPRRINSQYVMLSRQDNENNYLMFSDDLYCWDKKQLIMEPKFTWEFFQIGNCGSPIETSEGWLVLAHGVGPMRKYVISAFLLDLDNPTKVIGRLRNPLIESNESEREGYVPNVVYTCGGQIYNSHLIFPYAMSDYACSFALVNIDELLSQLKLDYK
ncbi:MAG: glycosidase, partial [Calditrichia bacterium]|nr:glycosidase [Calditrichia bacterium]